MDSPASRARTTPTRRRGTDAAIVTATGLLWLISSGLGSQGVVHAAATCDVPLGSSSYCTTAECGPCEDGEGDCDPGQCAAGLECVEEGAVDHCRPAACDRAPGAGDYCADAACGPCGDGEGDCDPGQCEAGLECVEEGAVDHCRPIDDTCNRVPGASDYCSSATCGPCDEGEGDCDPGQCAAGLECVEEGAVDRCRVVVAEPEECVDGPPIGAADYCSPWECGDCFEGEGDCDSNDECAAGYVCTEEGTIDRCRAADGTCDTPASSPDRCDACGPCGVGEGDCEPGECAEGLVCAEEGSVDRCRASSLSSNLEVKVNGVWESVCCVDGTPRVSDEECWWTEYGRLLTDVVSGEELDCPEGSPAPCDCDSTGERLHSSTGDLAGLFGSTGSLLYSDFEHDTCVVVDADGTLETVWTGGSCATFRLK